MTGETLFTIGQAAKICDISVQTLRFYDKIGLVHPAIVDETNGYRRYSSRDVLRIKIVQDLRSLNFSLDEISAVLRRKSMSEILVYMKHRREEAVQKVNELNQVVAALDNRIEQMERQPFGSGDEDSAGIYVEVRHCPVRRVAFDRRRSACGMDPYIFRFTELINDVAKQNGVINGHYLAIYHEDILTFDRNDADIEVCIPIQDAGSTVSNMRDLPAGDYVTSSYHGIGDDDCKNTYVKLVDWMNAYGYEPCGPVIEVYKMDFAGMDKPEDFLIELQIPVRKPLTL